MNKQEAMAMLKFISELYMIISTPDPNANEAAPEVSFPAPVIVK